LFVFGLIGEKLVDVFDGLDAEVLFGRFGEVEVVEFFGEQGPVQRPLRQRNLKRRLLVVGGGTPAQQAGGGQAGRQLHGRLQKITPMGGGRSGGKRHRQGTPGGDVLSGWT